MRARLAATTAVVLALAAPLAARAQTTTITPDVGALGLGTTATRAGNVVTIDGGALSGGNLFHSFSQFSVGAGDVARWTRVGGGAASVRNVVSRVTGGQVSQIAGEIDSTGLPNAAFFFINPAGVVFGAGAKVNVPAAAHFSTAANLRFADGATFAVTTPGGSTLSVAAPESFGFVGGQGAIAIDAGASLSFANGSAAFSASDIRVSGAVLAHGLDMAAFGPGSGTLALANPLATALQGTLTLQNSQLIAQSVDATAGVRLGGGLVSLNGSNVVSDTPGAARGGDILIAADQVRLTNLSFLSNSARGVGRGGDIRVTARDISGGGFSGFATSSSGAGAGGDVFLGAETFSFDGVTVSATASDIGAGGNVSVAATKSFVGGVILLDSNVAGAGPGGNITLTAPDLQLGGAFAFTQTQVGTPGDVLIHGGRVSISGGAFGSTPGANNNSGSLTIIGDQSLQIDGSILDGVTFEDGAAGTITLRSPQLTLTGGTFVDVEVFGNGTAGSILIDAGALSLDGARVQANTSAASGSQLGQIRINATGDVDIRNLSTIGSDSFGGAPGGIVSITGRNITVSNSEINSRAFLGGNAGSVSISAGGALAIDNSKVSSETFGAGDAGQVALAGKSIALTFDAAVTSATSDSGHGGKVTITGGAVSVADGSSISSNAEFGTGDAGQVSIISDSLTLTDGSVSSDTKGFGHAGTVTIKTGDLVLNGPRQAVATTFISSDTLGDGDAGDVTIDAKTVLLRDQGFISSDSFTDGAAGRVTIRAGAMTVQNGSYVASNANGQGHAGDVSITADTLNVIGDLENSTFIASASVGGGDAGTVTIDAKALKLDNGGLISSDTGSFGAGGDVKVKAGSLILDHFGAIRSAAFSGGDAGDVLVNAGSVTADNGATINSTSYPRASGAAGVVNVTAGSLALKGGSTIATASNNALRAGTVTITAGDLLVTGKDSAISSENQAGNTAMGNRRGQAGDAGAVNLTADRLTIAEGGAVTTNSFAGAAGAINVSIKRPGLFILQGGGAPGVIQTSSGPGTGGKITISDPLAIISNGGSILALGQLSGANVVIQSRYFINSTDRLNTVAVNGEIRLETGLYDVSSGTVSKDVSVLDASKVLQGQCPQARSTGSVSQLITRPVGPYVREADPVAQPAARPPGDCR